MLKQKCYHFNFYTLLLILFCINIIFIPKNIQCSAITNPQKNNEQQEQEQQQPLPPPLPPIPPGADSSIEDKIIEKGSVKKVLQNEPISSGVGVVQVVAAVNDNENNPVVDGNRKNLSDNTKIEENKESSSNTGSSSSSSNNNNNTIKQPPPPINPQQKPKFTNENDIPDSITRAFYILVGIGFLGVMYIAFRSFSLRKSRAARRYGTRGHHSTQELTPLPLAMEDDSDIEDQTLFEQSIQQQQQQGQPGNLSPTSPHHQQQVL